MSAESATTAACALIQSKAATQIGELVAGIRHRSLRCRGWIGGALEQRFGGGQLGRQRVDGFSRRIGHALHVVQAEGGFHLIQLVQRIPPKAVKFEDVKESLSKDLNARAVDATVKQLRQQLATDAVKNLVITDPELKKQWQDKLEKRDATIKDREQIRKQMQMERERTATRPATTLPDLSPAK